MQYKYDFIKLKVKIPLNKDVRRNFCWVNSAVKSVVTCRWQGRVTKGAQIHTVNTWGCCWNDPSENHPGHLMLLYPLTCSDETPMHHVTMSQSRANILTSVWHKENQQTKAYFWHLTPLCVFSATVWSNTATHEQWIGKLVLLLLFAKLKIDLSVTTIITYASTVRLNLLLSTNSMLKSHHSTCLIKSCIDTSDPGNRKYTCRNLKNICEVALNMLKNLSTCKTLVTARLHIFVDRCSKHVHIHIHIHSYSSSVVSNRRYSLN